MYLVILSVVGPGVTDISPATVTEILWTHATERHRIEHMRARPGPDGIDIAVFLTAGSRVESRELASDLCGRAIAASPELKNCRLVDELRQGKPLVKKLVRFAVVGIGGIVALAGCAHGAKRTTDREPVVGSAIVAPIPTTTPTSAFPSPIGVVTSANASPADAAASHGTTAQRGTPAPRRTTAPLGAGETTGCPVTAETLAAALKLSASDIYIRAGSPAALQDVACYENFAVAGTVPDGKSQPSRILFGYNVAEQNWRPLNIGSAGICSGYVSVEVADRLACG